jgi:predicted dehydrogenase
MINRREFLDTLAIGATGLAMTSSAKSYGRILGSNDRVNFAILGLHIRGYDHLGALAKNSDTARVAYNCDVDRDIMATFSGVAQQELGYAPKSVQDFREILQDREVDAITIATPDHWHTPLAIRALEAGKHVYVEKPCSHNPAEAVMIVQAQEKYKKCVQIGTQQRSCPHTMEAVDKIHNGLIGTPYFARAWYGSSRKGIGFGKEVPVPQQLDWDLWQGPAPRRPYHDNYQPYDWHWFKHWGTGEAGNNGVHNIDICRWALGVDYPRSVVATGGRYALKDDQQFYDTLSVNFDYGDKLITWEGRSCASVPYIELNSACVIIGTTGSVMIYGDGGDGYETFDLRGRSTGVFKSDIHDPDSVRPPSQAGGGQRPSGPRGGQRRAGQHHDSGDPITTAHFANFIDGIRNGEKLLHAPISEGAKSTTLMLLSNISWDVQRPIKLEASDNAQIQNDPDAMKLWSREYEKGWAPHL